MRVKIQKWGNSLALRIPKPFAEETAVQAGTVVDLAVVKGKLVAAPVTEKKVTLRRLLSKVTKDNLHGEIDFGGPVGRESW
jgi:antitoxin MazE